MTRRDLLIIIVVLLIAGVGFLFLNAINNDKPEKMLVVSALGSVYKEVSLSSNTNIKLDIETDMGLNRIEVKDGIVNVYEADCPDQICVHHVPIKDKGEIIVCLPNKVIIEIISVE